MWKFKHLLRQLYLILFIAALAQESLCQLKPEMNQQPKSLFINIQNKGLNFDNPIAKIIEQFILSTSSPHLILIGDQQNLNQFLNLHSELVPLIKKAKIDYAYKKNNYIDKNSPWNRDFAPLQISDINGNNELLAFKYHVDSSGQYKLSQADVADALKLPLRFLDLFAEGGNFLSDEEGRLYATRRVMSYNTLYSEEEITQKLITQTNSSELVWVNDIPREFEGTGHIDMYLRFVGNKKAIVAKSNQEKINGYLDELAKKVESFGYTVHRSEFEWTKSDPTTQPFSVFKSYSNALQIGLKMLVPQYGNDFDKKALKLYSDLGFQVVPIYSPTIYSGGALHCLAYLYY